MSKPQRWKPSVTVAAIVEHEGRFLIVEEATREGLRLNNPAGHLDPGESLIEAVQRETLEETGCTFTPESLVGVYMSRFRRTDGEEVTYLRVAFAGQVSERALTLPLDDGIVQVLWMTPQELRASAERHRSPLVLQCLDDHLAGHRFPLELLKTHPSLYDPWIPG